MPWFYCSLCCDTVKKPKVAAHARGCRGAEFTCIDCSRNFTVQTVQGHTSCVTEEQKYADGATKPGGFAANGFVGEKAPESTSEVVGSEYLSSGYPWRCSICKVDCTSEATLLSHATGQKHQRRCRAAGAAAAAQCAPAGKAGGADADGAAQAPATSDGVGEGRERDNSTKTKRKKSSGEDEPAPIEKKQKKVTGDATADISQLVVHALSKKGGTVRVQKLLAMVTKKLAKQDAEIADKEATLAKVLGADGTGYEVVVRLKEEE